MRLASRIQTSTELMKMSENVAVCLQDLLDSLPEDSSNDMLFKLRYSLSDIVGDIAAACGSLDSNTILYKLGHVRATLFETMAIVKLSHRLGRINLQPELMLEIQKLITLLDKEAAELSNIDPDFTEKLSINTEDNKHDKA